MRVSIVVPSLATVYLNYLLRALRDQSFRSNEVVIVVKGDAKAVEKLCSKLSLPCAVIEQKEGYFTRALNMGKKEATGDIVVFTDEDAIPPRKWVEKYVKLHAAYLYAAGICSRDIYLDLNGLKLKPTPDDRATVRLYRWLARPWLEPPHPLLKKYRLGVYLTENLDVAHGPYIPYKTCYSLPFRGVNMSFKTNYIYDAWFPEHKLLKRAPGNEQYFGLQLALKGLDTVYVPNNPVLHIARSETLSRTKSRERELEVKVMKALYRSLLRKTGA
jgi:glycosyltransferase involved in cell wall biosynthesis